jgi:translation initiation factor IF-1
MTKKEEKNIKDKTVVVNGRIVEIMPTALEYKVEIDFKGLKHYVTCSMSGRMKRNFIKVAQGDNVDVKISLYNIDRGVINYVYREKSVVTTEVK